ncbi:YgdI/YgdR family lipoprotein [Salidesulfovibrio onnuriiensis]|uniref:YgdI/YgdR family lipoprotein n=1 Tax=Salidesulfovibrio onnuriiensis TaxID=2583823 RepID=UPI00164FD0A7|nr:YgdI/YgdR family lipoprotein [Salidesulfovibrio onnuriiensis]
MKRLIALSVLALFLFAAAGCGSTSYKVVTADQTYVSKEKPEYDKTSETYTFTNEDGHEMTIKREDMKTIEKVK